MHILSAVLVTTFSFSLLGAQVARAADDPAPDYDSHADVIQQPGMVGPDGTTAVPSTTTTTTTTQQPGTSGADTVAPVSTVERSDVDRTALQQEGVAFQPQIGMINYHDTLGDTGSRMTYGLTA